MLRDLDGTHRYGHDVSRSIEAVRRRQRIGRVAYGIIEGPSPRPRETSADQFEERLVAGQLVERFGREWRVSRLNRVQGSLVGRLGFERVGGMTEYWDDGAKDFFPGPIREGTAVPFAIDVRDRLGPWPVAFQIRPPLIKRTSFTGALQDQLRATSDDEWTVTADVDDVEWPDWVQSVDRITQLRLRIEPPNPNWRGREKLRDIVEGTKAEMMEIVLTAPDGGAGLDITDEFVAQAIDHVVTREYGYAKAKASRGGRIVEYDSRTDSSPSERRFPADPETGEVGPSTLREALGEDSE